MTIPSIRRFISHEKENQLSFSEEPISPLQDHEVLIQVEGIGINRGDLLQRKGLYPPPQDASPILGLEVSGTVVAVGDKASHLSSGDRVCALTHGGGYCDYTAVPAHQCFLIPDFMDTVSAAALPEAIFTVWHNVFQRCHLKAGESLLIHGGASGIGSMAIQIGKAFGAHVYTSAGTEEKCKFCIDLGAESAINYKNEDFCESLPGMDVILDMAGGDFINKNITLANNDGRICSIAFVRGSKAEVNFAKVLMKRLTLTASTLRAQSDSQKKKMAEEIRENVWPKVGHKEIKPIIDSIFPFKEAEAAHQYMASNEHMGKILLQVTH